MKKNGFTLVELICVVMLLSIIITLVVVSTINILNNSKNRENTASLKLIETASKDYINKYENNYYINNGVTYCVPISDLVNENLLASNISYDGEEIIEKVVKIQYDNNKYSYTLDDVETCKLTETKK